MARPELQPRVSRLPCKHSTSELLSHMSTGYISPYLIRFVPESARNHAGTDETATFQVAALSPSSDPHWPPYVTGAKNEHGPIGTRTQGLSFTARALSLSYRATRSTGYIFPFLIRFVTESARNHAGTGVSFRLLLAARAQTHNEPPNATGAEIELGPTGTRTQS